MTTPREESIALGGSFSRIRRIPHQGRFYLDGEVVTAYGIVSVYSQSDGDNSHSRLDFAWQGRLHMRHDRERTERGLAIEATKFARRIAQNGAKP